MSTPCKPEEEICSRVNSDRFANLAGGNKDTFALPRKPLSPKSILLERQIALKEKRVLRALDAPAELKSLALEDLGLAQNKLRKMAWLTLVSVHRRRSSSTCSIPEMAANRTLAKLKSDHRQIELDCNRKFQDQPLTRLRLESFLHEFFNANLDLFYYQGFHDLCANVLETILGTASSSNDNTEDMLLAKFLVEKITRTTLVRDAMRETMDAVLVQLKLVHFIIQEFDAQLAARMERTLGNRDSIWAVSLLTCLFAHDVQDLDACNRLLDAILSSGSVFPLFLIAALATTCCTPLLALVAPPQSGEEDVLNALKNALRDMRVQDADLLVRQARRIMDRVPCSRVVEHGSHVLDLPQDSFLHSRFVVRARRSSNPLSFALNTTQEKADTTD